MSLGLTLLTVASAVLTLPVSATDSGRVCTRMSPLPSCVTIGSVTPAATVASRACDTVAADFGTWNSAPPLNSMPRLRPRIKRAAIATTTMTAEIEYQSLRRPTKS